MLAGVISSKGKATTLGKTIWRNEDDSHLSQEVVNAMGLHAPRVGYHENLTLRGFVLLDKAIQSLVSFLHFSLIGKKGNPWHYLSKWVKTVLG